MAPCEETDRFEAVDARDSWERLPWGDRVAAGWAGLVAAGVALGAGELTAGLHEGLSSPVLATLTGAVGEAGLVDTLNSAEALTVFAPTDCAFAAVDPATLDAALADPTGLLSQVLGFHVVPGDQLSAEELAGETELETFTGAMLPIESDGGEVTLNGGQATVVVSDIQTANATVHLIDSVMLPPAG